jgi:hypothetical protein
VTEEKKFVRVFDNEVSQKKSRWVMKVEDMESLTPILDSTGNWFCGIGVSEDHRLKGFLSYGAFYYIDSETGELTRGSPPGRAW